jgi:hypothetical protein
MWRCVDLVWTDVSEEYIAPIIRVEKSANEEPAWAGGCSLQRIILPWRWRRYVLPKRRFIQGLHGVTSQKTAFFISTAVKTSDLTQHSICSQTISSTLILNVGVHLYMYWGRGDIKYIHNILRNRYPSSVNSSIEASTIFAFLFYISAIIDHHQKAYPTA